MMPMLVQQSANSLNQGQPQQASSPAKDATMQLYRAAMDARDAAQKIQQEQAAKQMDLLLFVDDHFAHGNLRDWASFTATAVDLCQATGADQLDEQIARNAFALHGGVRARAAAAGIR